MLKVVALLNQVYYLFDHQRTLHSLLLLNILYSGQMQTAAQNPSSGSGQGSEQHSDTKRDTGGESSESISGSNPETGSDKVGIRYNIFLALPSPFFRLALLLD